MMVMHGNRPLKILDNDRIIIIKDKKPLAMGKIAGGLGVVVSRLARLVLLNIERGQTISFCKANENHADSMLFSGKSDCILMFFSFVNVEK